MSVQTLYSAATGMISMEAKLDVIANNLANVETTAFKRGRANFEEDRKSTRLNSSHIPLSRMPSSA